MYANVYFLVENTFNLFFQSNEIRNIQCDVMCGGKTWHFARHDYIVVVLLPVFTQKGKEMKPIHSPPFSILLLPILVVLV